MKRTATVVMAILSAVILSGQEKVTRLGIIGLDTSHSIAFTKLLNGGGDSRFVREYEVVAAYPWGSRVIESACSRIPGYTEEIKGYGVEIVDSIEELLDKVDCVFIETNDGHLHLEQAAKVFRSGRKCYIDKPIGATLAEAVAIYELSERYGCPTFSSSALRFSGINADIRAGKYGEVMGADCYSPHHPEKTHPDFGYYGLHGVETLYTVMGTGCESVSRVHSGNGDIVSGVWKDGRLGTFRALSTAPYLYGGTVILKDKAIPAGGYEGYMALLEQILRFFETDVPPVTKEETLEIFAFMEASNLSLRRGGKAVTLEEVYDKAVKEAAKLLRKY